MTLASVVPLAGVVALRLDESGVSFCYDDGELRSATGEARWRAFIAAGANGSSVGGGGARSGTYGRDPRFPGPAGADDPIGRVSALPREEAKTRVQAFGRTHSHAGLRRLDDAGLLSKLVPDQKILQCRTPPTAQRSHAARFRGDRLHVLLRHLEESDVERWYDLVVQATAADIERTSPQRSANSERVQQTMAAMMAGFAADDAQKLRRILANYAEASDDEVC